MIFGDIRMAKAIRPELWQAQILGYAENPLLRSGLALAGTSAWARGEPVPEEMGDGLLNSVEVAQLDLKATELVMLSACSTALGDITPGEGVAGLLQALRVAGARATAAALWQIPDESTINLSRAFYERLMGGPPVTPVTALCEAQQQLLRSGKPAWQWGAWVCYGGLAPLLYRPPGTTAAQSE
jgi:CHAT domain-containing protein